MLQIVRFFKQSILSQRAKEWDDLQQEFKQWDKLSDEALVNFEKDLAMEKEIKIPFLLSWVSQSTIKNVHDVTVYVPSHSEFELLNHNKPVQWALQRTLQRSVLTGKDLFFGLDYENKPRAQECKYPFFLWSLANKILTNYSNKLTNKIYDLGEFGLDEIIYKYKLNWISNLFPLKHNVGHQHNSDSDYEIISKEYPIKVIWRQLFDLTKIFNNCKIYWIEDQPRALWRAKFIELPVSKEIFATGNINIHLLKDENTIEKIRDFKTLEDLYYELDRLVANKSFNIFLVDMYFRLSEDGTNEKLRILGDNVIRRLREKENRARLFKNLVIVFTHGSSPFVVSRSKALNADLVVFKKQLAIGGHKNGEVVDAHFMLFWSIFWPLSVVRYICELFQRIIDTEPGDELKLLIKRANEEVGSLCPDGIFYFWQEWIQSVKLTLSKWNVILASHEAHKADLNTLKQKLANLLKQAYFK